MSELKKEELKIDKHPVPDFSIGDLVVIKSYPTKEVLKGEENNIPPIMVVIGIEIENKNKKIFDNELGLKIAERVKYNLIWFDSKKAVFVEKIMYESFIKEVEEIKSSTPVYDYGKVVRFKSVILEANKTKLAKSYSFNNEGERIENETYYSLLTYVCPDLVMSGIRQNNNKSTFNDFGKINKVLPTTLVKVMWFNSILQKYSEQELPLEVLIEIKNIEVHERQV